MQTYQALKLKAGDEVFVRFGGHGHQRACVIEVDAVGRRVRARKWRANSGRWTKPIWLRPDEIVNLTPQTAAKQSAEDRKRGLAPTGTGL